METKRLICIIAIGLELGAAGRLAGQSSGFTAIDFPECNRHAGLGHESPWRCRRIVYASPTPGSPAS